MWLQLSFPTVLWAVWVGASSDGAPVLDLESLPRCGRSVHAVQQHPSGRALGKGPPLRLVGDLLSGRLTPRVCRLPAFDRPSLHHPSSRIMGRAAPSLLFVIRSLPHARAQIWSGCTPYVPPVIPRGGRSCVCLMVANQSQRLLCSYCSFLKASEWLQLSPGGSPDMPKVCTARTAARAPS